MDWKPPRGITQSKPTYDVDTDGPPWMPPTPPETRWTRKTVEHVSQPVYDAYPDRQVGEPIAKLPESKEKPVPKPPTLQLKLIVQGPTVSIEVPLEKGFLEMFHESSRLQQGHLAHLIYETVEKITSEEEGQGLAEYALILGLIAIFVIVVMLFLGSQISGLLNTLGNSI
jgi:Flp pilus assembly pilin Flp